MHRRFLMMLSLGSILSAQVVVQRMVMADAGMGNLLTLPADSLVVLDDGKGTWGKAFQALMAQEPLAEWALRHRTLSGKGDDKATQQAREKHGWGPEHRWAYLGPEGTVKVQGTTLPTGTALAAALEGAGYKDPDKQLEAFARQHPEHADAQMALLAARCRRAERYMRAIMPPEPEGGRSFSLNIDGFLASSGGVDRVPTRALTEAEDRKFWGPCEAQLRKVFMGTAWVESTSQVTLPATARHSALMREACRVLLPRVEDLLGRYPSHQRLWDFWVGMARATGARTLRTLLSTLAAVPGGTDLPPGGALELYVKECQGANAWADLRDVLLPRWRRVKDVFGQLRGLNFEQGRDAFKGTWDGTLGPLVEALLRLGDTSTAEGVVEEAVQAFKPKNLPTWASTLALRCGKATLAQQWASLKIPD